MTLRILITAAALAVGVTTIAASNVGVGYGMVGRGGADRAMEMDDEHGTGHGNDKAGKHGKNAGVVRGARKIEVNADSFNFTPNDIPIEAGEDVTIVLHSEDVLHDFVVKREGHIVSAKGNKTARGGMRLDRPGTYNFWCSVAGHRSSGMRGTIAVT